MFSYYFQGLTLEAAMILPLGPQNAFMMNQGTYRQYHIMIALLCAISGLVLICTGIFGGSVLLIQPPRLLVLIAQGGVAFSLWYGFGAFKAAMSSNIESVSAEVMKRGRWKITATMLTVTWLSPRVYLDTFVIPGNPGGQPDVEPKRWFALGVINASFLWFFGLAPLTAWLAPRLRTAEAQRIIDPVVGRVTWFIALQLIRDGTTHARASFNQAPSDGKVRQRH